MTPECRQIMDLLGCDCDLFENESSGEKIIDRWNELAVQGKQEGFCPLLIAPSDTLAEAMELALEDEDLEPTPESMAVLRRQILEEAEAVDADTFLAERLAEYMQMHEDANILGKFRRCEPDDCFYCHMSGNAPHREVLIARIPTRNPWELPAWVPMGGFNDCPSPAEQVAVFKRWHARYGAVPGAVTYDNWELELTTPPQSDDETEALAREHFAFCYDIVMQAGSGWDTIRGRASALRGSTTWLFWWD